VESVVAPVPAAGGADPETDAMAFVQAPAALRDRGRAITGADLEAIALANAPEFSQARFIQSGGSARLVVVASGPDPRPDNAQRAAVRARLAAVTLPRLAAPGGLSVDPPTLRPLAIAASLTVESFDVGGAVDATLRAALEQLLDASTGGLDGSGWPLGVSPTAADLMAVLVDIDGLLDVTSLTIADVLGIAAQTISISFTRGSAQVDAAAQAAISTIANWAGANPGYLLTVTGYPDASGITQDSAALASKRAAAVEDALVQMDVDLSRIRVDTASATGDGRAEIRLGWPSKPFAADEFAVLTPDRLVLTLSVPS
jgi:flagellar motor protein MotB